MVFKILKFSETRDRISFKGEDRDKFTRKAEVSPALKCKGEKRQTSLCELLYEVRNVFYSKFCVAKRIRKLVMEPHMIPCINIWEVLRAAPGT